MHKLYNMTEKNIIPPPSRSGGRPSKYRFHELEINECREIDKPDKLKATQAAYAYGKKTGKRFVQRAGGLQIWRSE